MKRTSTLVIALWAMLASTTIFAQKGTEQEMVKKANTLFNSGEFLKAYPLFSQLVSLYPNHTEYNYKFGACAIFSDPDKTKAVKFLTIATSKADQDPMAWYYLGKAYHLNYQFKDAISAYEQFLRKADPKIAAKTDAQRNIETCIYGSNLLSSIKDISVINRTESDKQNFFRAIDLSGIGGKILTVPDELKSKLDLKSSEPSVMFYPGNASTIYFSSYGKDGANGKDIYKANILADGKFSAPERLLGDVNTKYDEDYCFMHSDGKTLYFASKGHNSMGGYDIFKSVLDPATGQFGPAINMDFAINTPDDDIFYITDSLNKRAYFASTRSSDQAHINVYNVFVESAPLQIVYLKGSYTNTINPDQKKATIQVRSELSGKIEMEGSTNMSNGNFLLYVQKPGEYSYKVKTENSPVVHEVKVNIPAFEKPVALRQEISLVSENGKDKLVVVNHFEIPLNEDISALAAEMLRRKSGLDVNTTPEMLSAANSTSSVSESITSLEHTMDNAPLAAGYADGISVIAVITGMEEEKRNLDKFIAESELKYDNGYAYALKKQREANELLDKAEKLRQSTGNYTTEEDVKKLRESMDMVKQAELLKRESNAAIVAAEAVKQYKSSEGERSQALSDRILMLKQANTTGNFDVAVQELRKERERVQQLKSGEALTPLDELTNKAKARESEAQKAEQKMLALRDEEKSLKERLKIAESKMSTAKKKADIQAAETEYATTKAELDNLNRTISAQSQKINALAIETKDAFANATLFKQLSENTEMNLNKSEQAKLSEQDKTALTMKLKEMNSRVAALEITDPQTLALVTDGMDTGSAIKSNTTTTGVNTTADLKSPVTTSVTDNKSAVTPTTSTAVNNIAVSTTGVSGANTQTTTTTTAAVAPKIQSAATIRTTFQTASARPGTTALAKRMYVSGSLNATNQAILNLETKKKATPLTSQEEIELKNLVALRSELQPQLTPLSASGVSETAEALRATLNTANPGYSEKLQEINNSEGTDVARMEKTMQLKQSTLEKLKAAKTENAAMAMNEKDSSALNNMATKDAQLEAAIRSLESETSDINQYRAAYDSQNKAIIESNDLYAAKVQERIDVTESYISTLSKVEAEKQAKLNQTTDPESTAALKIQLDEIKKEKFEANTKLQSYLKDLSLTAATSEAKASSTSVAVNVPKTAVNIADSDEGDSVSAGEMSAEDKKAKLEKDTETFSRILKTRVESESIFAYETGNFEEIVAQHQSAENEIKNREKIQELNDQIFLIEAEMENEKSESKLRKLDYKAEQTYLKRALLEITNAKAIENMTQAEYKEELRKAQDLRAANKEKIDTRFSIRDEVNRLFSSAEYNMTEAAALRKTAPAIEDDIEKADYYRQAFAKEALAIEQLKQIQAIGENIDAMLAYNEMDLAQMRAGKVPNQKLADNLAATLSTSTQNNDNPVKSAAASADVASVQGADGVSGSIKVTPVDAVNAANTLNQTSGSVATNNAASSNGVNGSARTTGDNNTANPVSTELKFVDITSNSSVIDNKSVSADPRSFTQNAGASQAGSVANGAVQNASDKTTSNNGVNTNAGNVAANTGNATNTAGASNSNVAVTNSKASDVAGNTEAGMTSSTSGNVKSSNSTTGVNNTTSSDKTVKNAQTNVAGNSSTDVAVNTNAKSTTASGVKNAASASSAAIAPSASASAAAYDDAEYMFSAPSVLTRDIFKRTTRPVYSESKPIPVDMPMPQGVYYKVQVGAFRNDIPQNLYDQFAPVCGENLSNGITRYTAGFFMEFKSADDVKREIRAMGYSDAFVVAYRDGKRIPLYEAMGKTNQQDFQAAIEKEYIFGDKGEAPVRQAEKSVASTGDSKVAGVNVTGNVSSANTATSKTATVSATNSATVLKTNYYKPTAGAAPAVEVETVKGLFYTVQVGVYSKPVTAKSLYNVDPLNTELTEAGKIRYTSGRYTSLAGAVDKRSDARGRGIADAFITAYYNGKRISLSEADRMLKELGPGILIKE